MGLVGALLAIPAVQKKAKGKMSEAMIAPYRKVIDQAAGQRKE